MTVVLRYHSYPTQKLLLFKTARNAIPSQNNAWIVYESMRTYEAQVYHVRFSVYFCRQPSSCDDGVWEVFRCVHRTLNVIEHDIATPLRNRTDLNFTGKTGEDNLMP